MLNWNFPLYRLGGIEVRIHWTLPLIFAFLLIQGGLDGTLGYAAIGLGILFIQVLAHEYGHAITARRLGEECESIMLSALGGAAYCGSGATTRHAMLITVMGPLVNLGFVVVSGAAIAALGIWSWTLLDPFSWALPSLAGLRIEQPISEAARTGIMALFLTFKIGFILMLFNLCVPAYPLDGGRLVLLWATDRYGRVDGAKVATTISIPIGFALMLWGLVQPAILLTLIGLMVLFEAYQIRKLIEFGAIDQHPAFPMETGWGHESASVSRPRRRKGWFARWRASRREKAERRRQEREVNLRVQVDQVLEKVSREGMGSLSTTERRILDEASRQYRGE